MPQRPRTRPHLYLPNNDKFRKSVNYTSPLQGNTSPPPFRNRTEHAGKLELAIGEAIIKARQQLESRLSEIAVGKRGFYLEFEVTQDKANAFETLENKTQKIELVAVKPSGDPKAPVKATVFVPESATEFFREKVEQYREEETKKGNAKNATLITRIENVEIGTAQSIFTDDLALFPQDGQSIWWEVWLRRGQLEDFNTIAQRLDIPTKSYIHFPERTVILAMANLEKIDQIIQNSDTVAELRIAKDTPSFFLDMGAIEQEEWAEDLWNRTLPPKGDAVAVCLLDTGVNWRHQLINKGLDISDLYTCDPNWGTHDHDRHGTEMAGLILYSDLFAALQTQGYITLIHRLESVKILPPGGNNEPQLYGAITEQAVSLPEIQEPKRKRIFCMAVTSGQPSPNYGTPSSWSAAIDQPKYWPETIRALIVHSAEWTSAMKAYFNFKKKLKQTDKKTLLRRYGYGVSDLDRALKSSNSDLTLIIEDQLIPFKKDGGTIKTNKMNFHNLPWPKEKLEELGEAEVELRVTLSYFIEPNPGERGYKRKHRYASYGLRFEVKRPLETDGDFQKRINKATRDEEEHISSSREDNNWFLGSQLRSQGSLHSDLWTGTAVDLTNRGMIGVYPIGGWWKEQNQLECYDKPARYTLIVTIRVPEIECDIYTPVSNLISQSISTEIPTEVDL